MQRTLSSTAVIAVTSMIDLALQSQTGPVALAVIARRQAISKSYMDQLFGRLRRAALVRSTRGPGGGYSLRRDAAAISVADIVGAVDKPGPAIASPRGAGDQRLVPGIWTELDAKQLEWLAAISLQALLGDRLVPEAGGARPPPIARSVGTPGPHRATECDVAFDLHQVPRKDRRGFPVRSRNGRDSCC